MNDGPLVSKLFFDMGRRLSRKARRHIEEVCERQDVPLNTWYRWWLETRPTYATYDNIVCSGISDGTFDRWLKGEREYAVRRMAAQLDSLSLHLKDAVLSPDEELSRPIRGVGPLVQFTIGRYLDHPQAVEWLREAATDEVSAKPWLAGVLSKYTDFLPEPAFISNSETKNGDFIQCHQGMKRIIS